jgi:hypothetical protein
MGLMTVADVGVCVSDTDEALRFNLRVVGFEPGLS